MGDGHGIVRRARRRLVCILDGWPGTQTLLDAYGRIALLTGGWRSRPRPLVARRPVVVIGGEQRGLDREDHAVGLDGFISAGSVWYWYWSWGFGATPDA